MSAGNYQGSEHLEARDGEDQAALERRKEDLDKIHAERAAEQLLSLSTGELELSGGKKIAFSEERKSEIRGKMMKFISEGIGRADADMEAGLDVSEWQVLNREIQTESRRLLAETAAEMEAEYIRSLDQKIDALSIEDVRRAGGKLEAVIKSYAHYERGSGWWRDINKHVADILGIDTEFYFTEKRSLRVGSKIQDIIRLQFPKHNCGSRGKIGPKTLRGLARILDIKTETKFVKSAKLPTDDELESAGYDPRVSREARSSKSVVSSAGGAMEPAAVSDAGHAHLPRERDIGFAQRFEVSDAEKLINGLSRAEKLAVLQQLSETSVLLPEQQYRLQQLDIIRTTLESIRSEIGDARTWSEWADQAFTEWTETTQVRQNVLTRMIRSLDEAEAAVIRDPNASLDSLIDPKIKAKIAGYQGKGKRGFEISTDNLLLDFQGEIREAGSHEDLQRQYLGLVRLLRNRKDYTAAQTLFENHLFAPYFKAKQSELAKNIKDTLRARARTKIRQLAGRGSFGEQWKQFSDLSIPDREAKEQEYMQALIDMEYDRECTKHITELRNGLPFELEGIEGELQLAYKDMMGTGEWHNFSDSTWDSIIEELVINAPLIIVSGGAAVAARGIISAGARTALASVRMARFASGFARAGAGLQSGGRLARSLYWTGKQAGRVGSLAGKAAGKTGGLLVEGAAFETVHSGLQGEWIGSQPDWVQRILWSSATLGVFHFSGSQALKINKWLAKKLPKFANKSLAKGIRTLMVHGNIEAAAMLTIGAIQHGVTEGDFDDWHFVDQLLHAYVSVGALRVAGGGLRVGKKFFPPSGFPGKRASVAEFHEAKITELKAKRAELDGQIRQLRKDSPDQWELRWVDRRLMSLPKEGSAVEAKYNSLVKKADALKKQIATEKQWESSGWGEVEREVRERAERESAGKESKEGFGQRVVRWNNARRELRRAKQQKQQEAVEKKREAKRRLRNEREVQGRAELEAEKRVQAEKEKAERRAREELEAKKNDGSVVEEINAKETREAALEAVSGLNEGSEVYVKRGNSVLERGWKIKRIREDGIYELLKEQDQGSALVRDAEVGELWSVASIERADISSKRLGDAVAEFERRKFRVLRETPTLSEKDFTELFRDWTIRQQNVGNCYLISAINSLRVSPHFEAIVRTSMKPLGKWRWEVKIPLGDLNGRTVEVTRDDLQPQKNSNLGGPDGTGRIDNREYLYPVSASEGFQILEAAYIKSTLGRLDRFAVEGGYGHRALLDILGGNFEKVRFDAYSAFATQTGYSRSREFASAPRVLDKLYTYLDNFHPSKDMATANTPPHSAGHDAHLIVDGIQFSYTHAYSIVKTVKPSLTLDGKGRVIVKNPWNTGEAIELTYDQFGRVFSQISGVRINYEKLFIDRLKMREAA